MSCRECTHYVSLRNDADPIERGLCRRFPPTVISPAPNTVTSVFPQVPPTWECGEMQVRKKREPAKIIVMPAEVPAPANDNNVTPIRRAA